MTSRPPISDPNELAELAAAGAASPEEQAFLEARLRQGDAAFVGAVARIQTVAQDLLGSVEPVQPPPAVRRALRDRMSARLASPTFADVSSGERDPTSEDPDRMVILRGGEMDWRPAGVDGVEVRNLFVDHDSNRITLLIRMAPGAVYPDHEHPGVEECMVVDGDLAIAGTVLRKGDYLRTPAGGLHGEPRTEGGCLLLVTCPLAA